MMLPRYEVTHGHGKEDFDKDMLLADRAKSSHWGMSFVHLGSAALESQHTCAPLGMFLRARHGWCSDAMEHAEETPIACTQDVAKESPYAQVLVAVHRAQYIPNLR
jgi:hypothetical protein